MNTTAYRLVLVAMAWSALCVAMADEVSLPAAVSQPTAIFASAPLYALPPTLGTSRPGDDMNPAPMALPRNEPPLIAEPGLLGPPFAAGGALVVDPATGAILPTPAETRVGGLEENAKPSDVRNGVFQKIILTGTWLPIEGRAGLGMTDAELKLVLAVPMPSREWPMLIIPGFAVHFLDSPAVDLPPRVYDAYVMFRWLPKLSPQWMLDLAVTPGMFGDFQETAGNAWHTTGHGAAIYTWSSELKLVGGVAYLDSRQWNFSPIAGVLWTPSDDWDFELVFPQPKIAVRIFSTTGLETVENWAYVAAEWTDSVWGIQQANGTPNRVAYRDARIFVGLEHKVFCGLSSRLEVGYACGRQLSFYNAGTPDFQPPGTMLLRGELRY